MGWLFGIVMFVAPAPPRAYPAKVASLFRAPFVLRKGLGAFDAVAAEGVAHGG